MKNEKVIFERHGNDATMGDVHIKIGNRTALSVFGGPFTVYDGDDYTLEKFWILNNKRGTRRKSLIPIERTVHV